MLYKKLDYLKEKVLYFDTDAIIYIDDGSKKKKKTGDILGEMTVESSADEIHQYVSTAPKTYSFKYGNIKQKSAIKGFTF